MPIHAEHEREAQAGTQWTIEAIVDLLELPLPELIYRAQQVHRQYHDPTQIELATLLSIKTGGCPEDCAYCPQSAYYDTGVAATKVMAIEQVRQAVLRAKAAGATRFCMGAAWRAPTERAALIAQLANLNPYPESVPINALVKVPGTPLADAPDLDPFEFVRTVAAARITMPRARVRLSAGRRSMDDAMQALCFLAGANSIFYGDKLLVTGNPDVQADQRLLARLGLRSSTQR